MNEFCTPDGDAFPYLVAKIMDLLEAAVDRREEEVARLRNPQEFKSLRQHPRMVRLLRRIGAEP